MNNGKDYGLPKVFIYANDIIYDRKLSNREVIRIAKEDVEKGLNKTNPKNKIAVMKEVWEVIRPENNRDADAYKVIAKIFYVPLSKKKTKNIKVKGRSDMIKHYCDRCGKTMDGYRICLAERFGAEDELSYEICGECHAKLVEFMSELGGECADKLKYRRELNQKILELKLELSARGEL